MLVKIQPHRILIERDSRAYYRDSTLLQDLKRHINSAWGLEGKRKLVVDGFMLRTGVGANTEVRIVPLNEFFRYEYNAGSTEMIMLWVDPVRELEFLFTFMPDSFNIEAIQNINNQSSYPIKRFVELRPYWSKVNFKR